MTMSRRHGTGPAAARLVAGLAGIAVIWCGILPQLLRCGAVARHVDLMERRGVNPAAMYYTELERLPLRPAWVADRVTLWPTKWPARWPTHEPTNDR